MITQVTYSRLHNLGSYENERFEVTVTVEGGDVAAAWTEARIATDEARAQMVAVRLEQEKERERIQEERRQARIRQREEEERKRAAGTDDDWL
jgi:hypothetical protein